MVMLTKVSEVVVTATTVAAATTKDLLSYQRTVLFYDLSNHEVWHRRLSSHHCYCPPF